MSSLLAASLVGMAAAAAPTVKPSAPAPVLIVMTSHATKGSTGEPTGFYLGEVTHPLAVFQAAGIPVEFASIQGGEPPVDGLDLKDATNARYWNDATFRQSLRTTLKLDDVKVGRYSAVFYAGGHGAVWDFPQSPAVQRVTREVYEAGRVVGAVCHGPAALVNVKLSDGKYLVAGKQVSAFTDDEERAVKLEKVVPFLLATTLEERGAKHQPAANWTAKVVVDGRLVTGQNPQSATGTAEAVRDLILARAAKPAP
ncbi:type 1 glutamine amidotransferase domain-containing protein [Corallococcus sp. BB11-1]|uniref:type 1 glutamine amidotransferase domain-containing protein n=1 Tax=Corallococcus sp. BB11-1 TaxID=2996783 RepID=UPI002271FC81|nr:type 1 glutamine amidotransferase domain-containing protein [Corallococcus sp. BB11-1]MCY1034783.1 type 1 glutamine amidotransferase domain-containing protein [Corallococcus sp. BB11-1]